MTETSLEVISQEVQEESQGFLEQASRIIVNDQETLDKANDYVAAIKDWIKRIKEKFNPVVKKLDEAHKAAVAIEKEALMPFTRAKNNVDLQILTYIEDQKRKRREAEEKAAEEEAKRLEAQRKAEDEARLLESKGQAQEAQELRDRVAPFTPPIIPEMPKMKNVHVRENWKFRVKDLALLAKMRPDLIKADEVKIGKLVRIHKEKTNIPGIEAYNESSTVTKI